MRVFLWINNKYTSLAELEVINFLCGEKKVFEEIEINNKRYLVVDLDQQDILKLRYLGLTKKAGFIIDDNFSVKNLNRDFNVIFHSKDKNFIKLAKKKLFKCGIKKISKTSKRFIEVFPLNNEPLIIFPFYKRGTSWMERLPHRMPGLFPATIHPLIARALVNITGSTSTIFDAFVGTGAFIIEAKLTKRDAAGIDIDNKMISRCISRLSHLNINAKVWVDDATKINLDKILEITGWKKVDAIVSEPPFGKNTGKNDVEKLIADFLINAEAITNKLVITFPNWMDPIKIISKTSWNILFSDEHRIHKSLSRLVFLLEK